MHRLVYRLLALEDLDAMFDFIAADNPARALNYVARIRIHCRSLCLHPELGLRRDDLGLGIPLYPYRRQLVAAYREHAEMIVIVRIFGAGMQYSSDRFDDV